ncbi:MULTISPECIES: hypothetical protein [unclassified Lysobacter]|uniref:hypothetical protein n=1 Tax=unclassified Lysobacter TaxID=2635362 RepID=UPI001BE7185C|nr:MULTISPECIES: hypothetical protein [unclassified Lysobacter]MBT2746189.1 hypothetical protein [Lysobacter sp. ISL-42]MBT2750734.1 hypothetical protein [Lysobacter sp. ISL-50]MBT2776119.1 hypothetical protein [Lysobacter sp. ISL-54]MBT2784625.1 hypothetical protein [Lysobacter sp. ISL-52]
MTRLLIVLKRSGHTGFNDLPLGELAECVIDGVAGVINPRTERMEGETVFVSYSWVGTSPPVIDNASLNRFGLCLADTNDVAYAITSDDAPRSAVSGSQMRAD